jgi:hypothetical protein
VSDAELVELIYCIALWRCISSVSMSLAVPLEDNYVPWPPDGRSPTVGRPRTVLTLRRYVAARRHAARPGPEPVRCRRATADRSPRVTRAGDPR